MKLDKCKQLASDNGYELWYDPSLKMWCATQSQMDTVYFSRDELNKISLDLFSSSLPLPTMEDKGPGSRNEFSKKAKKMKIPLQLDNKDWGKKTKMVARNCDNFSSGSDHSFYGSRTIMTKESFAEFLITESPGYGTYFRRIPFTKSVISKIKKLINQGSSDLAQRWTDALELVNKAFHVANVRPPVPAQSAKWEQYKTLIAHAVSKLADTRGVDGHWRKSEIVIPESHIVEALDIESPPGYTVKLINTDKKSSSGSLTGAHVEIDAETMDEVITKISNQFKSKGTQARVEYRVPEDKEGPERAVLSVWIRNTSPKTGAIEWSKTSQIIVIQGDA